ncbi:MAG: hydantoinase/oxoprolinase family protein [Burkholderiales bacterium]|nr:hydantoinase/oxoprolinase family protein [Burkholderiales bacterium]
MQGSHYRLAVDVGGTFTDLVMLDEASGRIQTLKVSSTPKEPSAAVLNAVERARERFELEFARVGQFTHATTVCSNTVLEGRGARTGLLVTEGFRDVLEIQRHKRYRLFDQAYRKTPPLVPRHLVQGVPERIDAQGEIVRALDEAALAQSIEALGKQGIEALAICFLFSFRNSAHERRAGEMARAMLPQCFVTISSEIFPQYREYERASTTVVNAYLGPRVSSYLQRMSDTLAATGIAVPLHMMQSNGGIIAWTEATRMPCRIVESGPAAGVIAAAHFGKLVGRRNLISFDMGGTTAKAGLIENGEVRQSSGQELGTGINISRILQGGGYYVGAATVDLAEVGAGGGSIAWVDDGNVLKVGPQSAGADPGPVAYGLGGENVTVTDANLLLGRIPADDFLGGQMQMDIATARRAVEDKIARPLRLSVEDACAAVVEVANASMLKMLRIVTVEKGCDPADFTMVAFGGNGPLHGPELAHDLGIGEVIVPPAAGVLSAQGLLVADIRYDFRQTHVVSVLDGDLSQVERLYAGLEEQGKAALRRYGMDPRAVAFQRSADMRYRRQAYEINVRLPDEALSPADAPRIAESFHDMHERLYGRRDPAGVVQFVTLCVSAIGNSRALEYRPLERGDGSARQAAKGRRNVFFRDTGIIDCRLYERGRLLAEDRIAGPALIETDDSTLLVLPGWSARCDSMANLILTREEVSA